MNAFDRVWLLFRGSAMVGDEPAQSVNIAPHRVDERVKTPQKVLPCWIVAPWNTDIAISSLEFIRLSFDTLIVANDVIGDCLAVR